MMRQDLERVVHVEHCSLGEEGGPHAITRIFDGTTVQLAADLWPMSSKCLDCSCEVTSSQLDRDGICHACSGPLCKVLCTSALTTVCMFRVCLTRFSL